MGRTGDPDPSLDTVLDTFARALPQALERIDAPSGAAVELRVSGPAGGVWSVRRRAHGWALERLAAVGPAARITMDAETFRRLCTRGIEPAEAHAQAHVRGDPGLVDAALQIVAIIR